ncbi:hypothetical protein JNL27_15050, partial [bacterium]|nr:hypothetical protein [bacterium]
MNTITESKTHTINAEWFWDNFCNQKPLKHYNPSNAKISKIFSSEMKMFLEGLKGNNFKLRPNKKEKEFLLDGILFENGVSHEENFVKKIILGIEWQWDWGKKKDLLYHDFTKLLHVRCHTKVLMFYIRNNDWDNWNQKYGLAVKIIENQIRESQIEDEFL